MSDKRGQTEDFLGDFVPAIVIIVIAVIIGGVLSSSHTDKVEEQVNLAAVKFNSMDAFAFLRMPVESGDMASVIASTVDGIEAKDNSVFESGFALQGAEFSVCGPAFEQQAEKFFNSKRWEIVVLR